MVVLNVSRNKGIMLYLNLNALTKGMCWCYLWHHWYHLTTMQVPVEPKEFNGAIDDARVNGIIWPKSHVVSHFHHLDLRNACAIVDSVNIIWHWCQHQWQNMTQKVMLHLSLIILTSGMQWYHWCHQCTMIPESMESHDQYSHVAPHFDCLDLRNAVVPLMMPMLVPMASHGQKSHVVPHFDYLDLRNAIVPLTMPSVYHAASANGITWPIKSCCTSFWLSWSKECNCCHWWYHQHSGTNTGVSGVILQEKSCYSSCLFLPEEYNGVTNDSSGSGITWPKGHFVPHFDYLDLRNAILLLMTLWGSCDTDACIKGITWPVKSCCT